MKKKKRVDVVGLKSASTNAENGGSVLGVEDVHRLGFFVVTLPMRRLHISEPWRPHQHDASEKERSDNAHPVNVRPRDESDAETRKYDRLQNNTWRQ